MQSKNVKIGQTYWAKISGKSVKARIESVSPYGGWDATNLSTGRKARIKSVYNLDEIIEGKNVHSDRRLKKQQKQGRVKQLKKQNAQEKADMKEAAKAVINSTHNKIKQQNKALKKAIATYLKVKESDIKAIITTPEYNYEVDLKNGQLYEVTLEELNDLKKQKAEAVQVTQQQEIKKDKKIRVELYFNRNKKCFSIKHKNKVIGYTNSILLENCKFTVRQKGRERVLSSKMSCVHAFVSGDIIQQDLTNKEVVKWLENNKAKEVTYQPFLYESFVVKANKTPITNSNFTLIKDLQVFAICN